MITTNGMLLIHESNIRSKIDSNYNGRGHELFQFLQDKYLPMQQALMKIHFSVDDQAAFQTAADIINAYFDDLWETSKKYNIKSQSKFESTYYEELSSYLFRELPPIASGVFSIFNKGIYAGLKIDNEHHVSVIKKDVDFCIGKKARVAIDRQAPFDLILPIVAVEVKTYLDATMFGEVKSSSKAIRSASPNSRAYVLMGYKDLADEHIIAARQDSTLTEMFALRKNENHSISAKALYEYYVEIADAVMSVSEEKQIQTPGRLLFPIHD